MYISAEQFRLSRSAEFSIGSVHFCNFCKLVSVARHLVNENDAVSHMNGHILACLYLFDLGIGIGVGNTQHIPIGKFLRCIGDFLVHREKQHQSQQAE